MRRILLTLGIAATAAGLALPAAAAETASPRAKMMFWFMDRNGDGYIDATEIEAVRTARFKTMDADGDGKLTRAEANAAFEAGRGRGWHGGKHKAEDASMRGDRSAKREQAMLKRFGFTDGSDSVTLVEFVAVDSPMLKRADTNGDGKISEAEFLAMGGKAHKGMARP